MFDISSEEDNSIATLLTVNKDTLVLDSNQFLEQIKRVSDQNLLTSFPQ